MKQILLLGGTGFVGAHVCEKAGQLQCRLTLATRRLENAKPMQSLPWVDPVAVDVHDEAALTRLVRGHDAVLNLVAILHGDAAAFTKVHVDLPAKLLRACAAGGVRRLVHVSALGAAADAPSMYQRSKAQAEALLRASDLDLTILRPSVLFGAGDRFLNLFAKLQAFAPFVPLAGARTRFQPVWVEDVAQAIVNALRAGSATGRSRGPVLEACGPELFTLRELVQIAGRLSGHPRPVFALPTALGRLQALLLEFGPGQPLMSRDNLEAMQTDNVASGALPGLEALGVQVSALSAIAPTYLRPAQADVHLARRRIAGRF